MYQTTGNLVVIVTNTDTEASITVNASGPTFTRVGASETNGRGNNIQLLDPNQAASSGLPEMFVNSGYIDLLFNDDDTVTVRALTGHLTDLCEVLT